MNATPTTLNLTARGWVPVEGQDIIITLGSINNTKRCLAARAQYPPPVRRRSARAREHAL
jgi:hypothetical protein